MFDEYFVGNLWEDYDTPREGNILDESAFRGTNDPRPWASNISKTALEVRTYGAVRKEESKGVQSMGALSRAHRSVDKTKLQTSCVLRLLLFARTPPRLASSRSSWVSSWR